MRASALTRICTRISANGRTVASGLTVILIGNTAVGAGAALGLPILDVPPLTGLYAFLGSAAFGLEAWLELRDLGRLERVRAEKEKDAAEKERLGHTRRRDDVPKGEA